MATEMNDALAAMAEAQKNLDTAVVSTVTPTQPWSSDLVQFLSISLLAFTTFALIMASVLMWRTNASPQHILRVFGIVAIIGVSALLLVTGFSNDQLTPIIGLFGAIAGYLLGKDPINKEDAT